MNLLRKINWLFTAILCIVLVSSCSDDDIVTGNGTSGYLKLRLTSSKAVTRATSLNQMADAKKVEVSMLYNDMYVTQSLNLSSVADAADLGLESEKLELQAGDYRIMSYTLYGDVKPGMEKPNKLTTIYPDETLEFTITSGHLTELDVKVRATVGGNVYFNLLKDLSNYQDEMDKANGTTTRASLQGDPKSFNYDNVEEVELYIRKKGTSEYASPQHFKVYDTKNANYLHTDTLYMESGEYEITRYILYDDRRTTILLAGDLTETYVTVATGANTEGSVQIKFPENMEAINDYIALYTIWVNLDGPNWSYSGETFPAGANWRFADRPIDEWGNQPGVEIDNYGRVKQLDLGSFNPKGAIPAALGQLTELVSLSLGTHNDIASVEKVEGEESARYSLNPMNLYRKGIDYRGRRMEIEKERLSILHPSPLDNSKLYSSKNAATIKYATPVTYDFAEGSISNRITSIPKEIGKLTKLNYLYVANNLIGTNDSDLPVELADLPDLTDVEFYNCQFKVFPTALKKMKHVVSMNFSCNSLMEPAELLDGLNEFIRSNKDELQILYVTSCGLEEFPMALKEATKIGLLDLTSNKLTSLPSTERKLAPVQIFLDDNKITELDDNFIETDDIEKFSISNNRLTELPGLFKNGYKSKYKATSVDFSDNHIRKFSSTFKGINAETLTLTKNEFGLANKTSKGKGCFPAGLGESQISYLLINNCELDTIVVDNLKGLDILEALDLSGNNLKYLPVDFNSRNFVFITGLNLSYNRFANFPMKAMELPMLNKLYLTDQFDVDPKNPNKTVRVLKTWPSAMSSYPGYATLRLLDVSYNDIQSIPESQFPSILTEFNISENNNIEVTIPTEVCSRISSGLFTLGFDSNQYILGCPILDLDINK